MNSGITGSGQVRSRIDWREGDGVFPHTEQEGGRPLFCTPIQMTKASYLTLLRFWKKLVQERKQTYLGTSIQETAAKFLEVLEGYVLKWHFVPRVRA